MKKKLLICGDSYMAFDDGRKNGHVHWAHHLGDELQVINRAMPGASNTLINWQLMSALQEFSPDFIVLGFTAAYRLEVSKEKTTCWPEVMALPGRQEFFNDYIRFIDSEIELHRNCVIIDQTIRYSREKAPTCFVFNNFDVHLKNIKFDFFNDLLPQEMNFKLRGHREVSFGETEYCSFHVVDPQVHLNFASEIQQKFLTS